jgi:hypothetical protein
MDFDGLIQRYFAVTDIAAITPAAMAAGAEHMLVDLGMEQEPGKRFALWALLYLLGEAPDLEASFEDPGERDAARNFMDMIAASNDE